ncbi:asparagine synthetase B family protein [Natronorarus salvus]|uniref:hypothetical protein n=1 Tax=Natronorarus salvus TaxID=3117733 RepID=UPI002F26B629
MNTELFGVFGDEEAFAAHRPPGEFDEVLAGEGVTVGIADDAIGIRGRSDVFRSSAGLCAVFGEAFPMGTMSESVSIAEWLFEQYVREGLSAFDRLNGSYLAVVEHDDRAVVVPDQLSTWECFYTDDPGVRAFGTDAASVTRTVRDPTVDRRTLCEFVHFSVTFGERTAIEEVSRTPFDSCLTERGTVELDRFVYAPRQADHVEELAGRLRRAIERRATYPGQQGFLMSAGYDSRIMLSFLPNVECGYTLGSPDSGEVRVARALCEQYGADHRTLRVDDRYYDVSERTLQYTQGIRESLHIHHRGNTDDIEADVIYHGLMFDTLLRGFYLPTDGISLFGKRFPRSRLDPDPNPAEFFWDRFGTFHEGDKLIVECDATDAETPREFFFESVAPQYERCLERADGSVYNAMSMLGLMLKVPLPFRVQLADRFTESFVAVDAELVDWHLRTPPEHRNDDIYQRALERLDGDIFRHRPPDRPHRSYQLNQIEKFLRRVVPGLTPFDTPWPDWQRRYVELEMDDRLFPGRTDLHALPPRIKLRLYDTLGWTEYATDRTIDETSELIRPV